MAKENRLFLSNPGTGKSTLINCLIGTFVFQSGVQRGDGLTRTFQRFETNGVTYMDTPGLANKTFNESAAQEITTALKQSGFFKLFFMVRFQNGRVVAEDLSTIESVLDSIEIPDVVYSVIVNNISKEMYETISSRGSEFDAVVALINSGRYSTRNICFIPTIDELTDKANKVVELPPRVVNFIELGAPVNCIFQSEVKAIEGKDFQQQTEKIQENLEEIRRGNAEVYEKMVGSEREAHVDPQCEAHVSIDVDDLPAYPTAVIVEPIRQTRPHHAVSSSVREAVRQPRTPYTAHPSTPVANNDTFSSDEMVILCCCCFFCGPLGVCCYILCCRDANK